MADTKKWPGKTIRGFGIAGLVYVTIGLAITIPDMLSFHSTFPYDRQAPYLAQAYFVMSSINLAFELALGILSVCLIKRNVESIAFCNVLFALQILYMFAPGMLWGHPTIGMSVAGATGIANVGLAAQDFTGYPLIALIALNIAKAHYGPVNTSAIAA